jgi:hypothetical protein
MNIFDCAKPFLVLLKVFGLFPVTNKRFSRKKTKKLQKLVDEVVVGFVLILSIVLVCINVNSGLFQNVWHYSALIGFVTFLIIIFYQKMKWKAIWKILKTIDEFDRKVSCFTLNFEMKLFLSDFRHCKLKAQCRLKSSKSL